MIKKIKLVVFVLLSTLLHACSSTSNVGFLVGPYGNPIGYGEDALHTSNASEEYVYKLYSGNKKDIDEIAEIDLKHIDYLIINQFQVSRFNYQKVHLLPGQHTIRFSDTHYFSSLVEPEIVKEFYHDFQVELQAGHTYGLYSDRSFGPNYQLFYWIEDEDTQKVVAGNKKP